MLNSGVNMQNIKKSHVIKGLLIVAILLIGVLSFAYIDFFSTLKSALLLELTDEPAQNIDFEKMQEMRKEMEGKTDSGEIDKGSMMLPEGLQAPSLTSGLKGVLGFVGILTFVIFLVYYLDDYIGKQKKNKRVLQKAS